MSEILITNIVDANRIREDYGDLDSDFASVFEHGLIQPIILNKDTDGTIQLIAGGRRLEWLRRNGFSTLYHGSTGVPNRPGYVLASELPEADRLMMEIAENMNRFDTSWQENCLAIFRLHELKDLEHSKWAAEQTGKLLGVSAATAKQCIRIGRRLKDGDTKIKACSSMRDALAELTKERQLALEKQMEAFRQAAVQAKKAKRLEDLSAKSTPVKVSDPSSPPEKTFGLSGDELELSREEAKTEAYITACNIIKQCDSLKEGMPQLEFESFDLIYTDIPYGIDADNIDMINIDETKAEHDRESNIRDFETFLSESYRLLKPKSWLVFWHDIEHSMLLRDIALRKGFKCQRWPLHWHKSTPCKNQAPQVNTTKNYESLWMMRKDNALLNSPVSTSIFSGTWEKGERDTYTHPFAKPFEVHEKILKCVAKPGMRVLNPYAGEGSEVLACLRLDMSVVAFDLKEDHVRRAREHIVELLCTY